MEKDLTNFEEIILQADILSKKKFLKFSNGIYHTNDDTWDHLWEIPIISTNNIQDIFDCNLPEKFRDDILNTLYDYIYNELGDAEAVFISYYDLKNEDFENKELSDYLNYKDIKQKYNTFIIYNDDAIKETLDEFWEHNVTLEKPLSKKELYQRFCNYIALIFTHERCHLNAEYLLCTTKNENFEIVNGILPQIENEEVIVQNKKESTMDTYTKYLQKLALNSNNRNEILIDTLAQMIMNYETNDTIEDCLYKIIKKRGHISQYEYYDDSDILALYSIFSDEFARWSLFGAYDDIRINPISQKFYQVYGVDINTNNKISLQKAGKYFSNMDKTNLSLHQIAQINEMLNMLGIPTKDTFSKDIGDITKNSITIQDILSVKQNLDQLINFYKDENQRQYHN